MFAMFFNLTLSVHLQETVCMFDVIHSTVHIHCTLYAFIDRNFVKRHTDFVERTTRPLRFREDFIELCQSK